ncbi:MAG: aminotransferase class I/II-fold pyridoxal phosphate-dependent enzyme [Gemmatimonadetes bacterium]|nr:aminotransferase class I/II-fold pyridoxal phosphate-dependent enzyme [Gemmatimonadota bacterium]MCY3678910.1 aminotransferase class I/II-fold pyridoxal phosphate-dependent enzyme [Gemmatimonadota bacterium]
MKGASRDVIDLSMNEGEPPPRECFDVLERVGPGVLRKYADPRPLEEAYAAYLGTDPANVLATTGGDDAIDRVFRAFLGPEQEMVFPTPTFEMIPACARMARGTLVPVEYEWGTLPHDEILAAVNDRTGVVAVLTPDNPTGRAFTTRELLRLADALPPQVVLLVDSAYAEFADEDHTAALLQIPRVVMIRTMSKSWGLAGLRVGFAVGPKERIDVLRGFGGPYALTGPSIAIVLDRLQNGVDGMRGFVEYVRGRRERLAAVIRGIGGVPQPSQTNFVFSSFPDARWILRGMAAQRVLVRYFPHLPEYVRITVPRDDGEFRHVERALGCLAGRAGGEVGATGVVGGSRTGPEALLFDMDGVLADVRRSYRESIVRTCASFGVEAGHELISAVKAAGGANDDWAVTHGVLAGAGVEASLEEVTARFEEIYQGTEAEPGLRRHETLIPSRELLEGLARSFRLGIVTGRPRADAQRFLREQGVRGCFSAVVCREDAPLKPDPAPVLAALEQLDARTAWMLGDTPDDVRAAVGAGVVPVGVVPPGQTEQAATAVWAALEDAGAARVVNADSDFGGLFDG